MIMIMIELRTKSISEEQVMKSKSLWESIRNQRGLFVEVQDYFYPTRNYITYWISSLMSKSFSPEQRFLTL